MNRLEDQREETGVLVIGCGGAGLMAAVEASQHNVDVTVVAKGLGASPGVIGFNVPLDPRDSPSIYFKDTVVGGAHLNDRTLVKIMVNEARKAMAKLESIGVQFDRTNGDYDLMQPLGCAHPRLVHYGNVTGPAFLRLMSKEIEQRAVGLRKNIVITSLLVEKDAIVGACGIDAKSGDFLTFEAQAVVLAAGGGGQLYPFTTYPRDATCDGYAIAYDKGAELVDMEFVQFEPCRAVYPDKARGFGMVTTFLMEGGELRNVTGERFMRRYDPKGESAQKDVMARAICEEIRAGRGTEHGGVYFDVSMLPEKRLVEDYASYFRKFYSVGVDIRREPVEVAPAAHSFMGGLKISEKCETSIRGLYAAGEIAGGIHGANRLGGNAGTSILVFGSRAGISSAQYALSKRRGRVSRDTISKERRETYRFMRDRDKDSVQPLRVKSQIHNIMSSYVHVVRNEGGLKESLDKLSRIEVDIIPKISATDTSELLQAHETKNMLLTAEMIVRAALKRTESRGAHYREDYPNRNDKEWLAKILIRKINGRMEMRTRKVAEST